MKYSPECVAAFEAFAASNRWDIDKDEGGYYIDWSMAAALAAFAANWERVRELEKMLAEVTERADRLMGTGKGAVGFSDSIEAARKLLEKGNE